MHIGHCFGGVSGRCGWKPASAPATSMEMGEETQLLRRSRIGRAISGTPEPWISHGSPASGRTDRAPLECWVSGGISTQSGTGFSTGRPVLTGSDQRPAGQKDAAQFERAAAVRTHGGLPGLDLNFWLGEKESIGKLDQPPDGFDVHLAPGIHEAEIADFHEPGWQDVLEEAPHEFDHVEHHGPPAIASGLLGAKRDGSLFKFQNSKRNGVTPTHLTM